MTRKFDLSEAAQDSFDFQRLTNEIKEEILNDFGSRREEVEVSIGPDVVQMTKGKLLVNLFLLKPLVSFSNYHVITKEDLYPYDVINEKNLEKYFNRLIQQSKEDDESYIVVEEDIYDVINEISDISGQLNVLFGNTISFRDFIRLSVEDPEADQIFNQSHLEYGLQFNEVEERFKKVGDQLENLYKRHPESELNPFIMAGTGINKKQLTQALAFVGLKPDIDGSVIPVAIDENYLKGLSNIENYFINCKGTRKALITNYKSVRKSGYLTRKLSLAMMNTMVDTNVLDCGSKHYIKFKIDSQTKLRMIEGRHFYDIDQQTGEKITDQLNTVNMGRQDLIGKVIGLRSPVTCACKDGKICKTCYGRELAEVNKGLHNGLIAVLFLTNPLTQKLLSAKHLLSTSTEKINWGQDFNDSFVTNMNNIYFGELPSSFTIKWNDILLDDEDNPYVTEFDLTPPGRKSIHYTTPVDDDGNLKLYLNDPLLNIERKDEESIDFTVSSKNFPDDVPLFSFTTKNNELSKSLQQILDLVESTHHLKIEDMNEFVNKFADLLIENGMSNINSVHVELISSVLFRDEDYNRLDFLKNDIGDYQIIRISKAISLGPLSTSLAFERLNDQFINVQTYEKENPSYTDYLFR